MTETPRSQPPLVLSVAHQMGSTARRTKRAYASGRTVYWTYTRELSVKRASAALGDWAPAHLATCRLEDEDRQVIAFVPPDQPVQPMTYFRKRKTEHVLCCSACGAADHGWAWDAPAPAPEGWTCQTCGGGNGETREVAVKQPQPGGPTA